MRTSHFLTTSLLLLTYFSSMHELNKFQVTISYVIKIIIYFSEVAGNHVHNNPNQIIFVLIFIVTE